MKCSKCGRIIEKNKCLGGMCQACYYYFKNGGTENELPSKGVIKYDERGCVICHICGRAYKRLGSHVKESHNMTIFEYKEQFGLCNNARTTEENYSKNMSKLAYKYDMHKSLQNGVMIKE